MSGARNYYNRKEVNAIKRTISVEVGKGSQKHNSRVFNAKNTDPARTHLNTSFCNENIKEVYHELFDSALERYNAKQKRKDRVIPDYYEHIRSGNQEKPFHEVVVQIGNKDDTGAMTDIGKQAEEALKEYYKGFQKRNPFLRVFSAHIHMDEATPHIHIDFVPFTTGSTRGLDTRVSLKKALAAQGFTGGTKEATEWNQWVQSEKEALSIVMERFGFEWLRKGTHEKHLTVYDFEKKMRAQEVQELTVKADELKREITESESERTALEERISIYTAGGEGIKQLEEKLDTAPELNPPEPPALMSARSYKTKIIDPIIKALKQLAKALLARCFQFRDEIRRLTGVNQSLVRETDRLNDELSYLQEENDDLRRVNSELRQQNKRYALLCRIFGNDQIDKLIDQAKERDSQRRRNRSTSER